EYADTDALRELLMKTIYMERIRIKEDPWKVDPPDDRSFWKKLQQEVYNASTQLQPEQARTVYKELLHRIIHRYSEEIVATFKIKTFLFARKFLTFFFSRLLNAASARRFRNLFRSKVKLYERLQARGEIELVRSLMSKGTVVVLPTHFSNLDSILVGYVMDAVLGLPSFSYGAGLNLLNSGIPAYYINRIGAYRVDRRKKNPIYLKVLKSFSNASIQRGTNSLFFPGGTRSRDGSIETRLKMGLLGTTVEAQRIMLNEGRSEKVFIVPVVLGYNVVLEAKFLIEQHLKRTGREKYLRSKDQFYSTRQILKFVWNLFSKNSTITTSFGKPMDVLGNFVDAEGRSFDRFGREVDIREYFVTEGVVTADRQREREYTKLLSERIVERYFKENIVLPSHLAA
ncbi:MAG: 1-acyl-sn-glycerol-3-phosphate acyltransferase, partial [Phaeodactylibacter sp.]|nr:1-acyl-sn-glycerol-3-phosphate acyltransferase [Phaeodactylibacter sp.]